MIYPSTDVCNYVPKAHTFYDVNIHRLSSKIVHKAEYIEFSGAKKETNSTATLVRFHFILFRSFPQKNNQPLCPYGIPSTE